MNSRRGLWLVPTRSDQPHCTALAPPPGVAVAGLEGGVVYPAPTLLIEQRHRRHQEQPQ